MAIGPRPPATRHIASTLRHSTSSPWDRASTAADRPCTISPRACRSLISETLSPQPPGMRASRHLPTIRSINLSRRPSQEEAVVRYSTPTACPRDRIHRLPPAHPLTSTRTPDRRAIRVITRPLPITSSRRRIRPLTARALDLEDSARWPVQDPAWHRPRLIGHIHRISNCRECQVLSCPISISQVARCRCCRA